MGRKWIVLFWMFLPLLGLSGESRLAQDQWTVERFSGALSGTTVTVTQSLWGKGVFTEEGQEGPLRAETAFALRCMQEELKDRAADQGSGYTAVAVSKDRETGAWLKENAWRFGLEAEEKEDRIYLRYVGAVHAAAMHALGMDRTEYLLFLRKAGQAVLKRNGRDVGWIFCVPAGASISFKVPEGAAWEISGDGGGRVIIAVRSGC